MSSLGKIYSTGGGDPWKKEIGESLLRSRRGTVLMLLAVLALALFGRACYLQLVQKEFLQGEGLDRYQRLVKIPAFRGMILDRNGEPLAISTPVESIWVNPVEVLKRPEKLPQLASAVGMEFSELETRLKKRATRKFYYLKRQMDPSDAARVMDLNIRGVYTEREYRRFYPTGEVTAHLLGFANIDHQGQEGLELRYNEYLGGHDGSRRVIRDLQNRVVGGVGQIEAPVQGKNLTLSIDQRLQYLAYRELKVQIAKHNAKSGSVVILDPRNGEVLAMVNQPSYNPNSRKSLNGDAYRNRAVTDVFEPGSTIKPFTVAAALEAGTVTPTTIINTAGGTMPVGRYTVRDVHAYGNLDVTGVITKSSNVGAARIALRTPREAFARVLSGVGFGQSTGAGFPGEVNGVLENYKDWAEIRHVNIAFGYGFNATVLQLAQAYAVLANGGVRRPVTLITGQEPKEPVRVMSAKTAEQVIRMMETVVSDQGTARQAKIAGYRIAGKTGTSHKSQGGGYAGNRYVSVFAGIAPASDPRMVMVVMIDEPRKGGHYGGVVAAPVFARVMSGALRMLDVKPDNLPLLQAQNPPQKAGST